MPYYEQGSTMLKIESGVSPISIFQFSIGLPLLNKGFSTEKIAFEADLIARRLSNRVMTPVNYLRKHTPTRKLEVRDHFGKFQERADSEVKDGVYEYLFPIISSGMSVLDGAPAISSVLIDIFPGIPLLKDSWPGILWMTQVQASTSMSVGSGVTIKTVDYKGRQGHEIGNTDWGVHKESTTRHLIRGRR